MSTAGSRSAVLALLLLALVACDSSRKQIVGKWKTASGAEEMVWEFSPGGAVTMGGTPGRYSFGDNQRLKIETRAATFVYQIEFTGSDRMTWTNPSGAKTELQRVK